jgi:hypothetical protein
MNVMKTICGDLKNDDQMVNLAQKTVKKDLPKHYCICMILSEQMNQSLKCNFPEMIAKHDEVLQQKAASDYFLTLKARLIELEW